MATPRRDPIFRVFVSSTFSDLVEERNMGARFQAIDLRWGVSQEAGLDQQTMTICRQELRRCQQMSPRPNFLVVLGNRYGWRPLPSQIAEAELGRLAAAMSEADRRLVLHQADGAGWYRLDANADPPAYSLRHRAGELVDYDRWTAEETALRAALLRAAAEVFDAADPAWPKYLDSATHQEIRHGAFEASDPASHVFCYFREIDGLPADAAASTYRDMTDGEPDTDAEARLAALKGELRGRLGDANVHEYRVAWDAEGSRPAWPAELLGRFCEDVRSDLQRVIDEELRDLRRQPESERTNEAHRDFAEERARHFRGRGEILERIERYLASDATAPLIVHGGSGSGKTAILARAWVDLLGPGSADGRPVVARFIGATPASSDLRSLLGDLCRRMGIERIPTDMNELVAAFRGLLSAPVGSEGGAPAPVVVLLDGLDQLNPTDNAHMLYWLPRDLAAGVKVVLSVLRRDDAGEPSAAAGSDDPFEIARESWGDSLVEVGPWSADAAAEVLGLWLAEAGRTLQADQRDEILTKFAGCPKPLYLRLAFDEARRWPSWAGVPADGGLAATVEGVLADLLGRLERPAQHGRMLTERALAYIASGRHGLTEDELIDVLSADREVLEAFHSQSPTEMAKPPAERITRLPVVVWSRLYADAEPYMTQRRADGTQVLDFYHRQVGLAVRKRYLDAAARLRTHERLAAYFDSLGFWAESEEAQRERARRLPPTPRPANIRKVVELPYHRLEAAKLGGGDDASSPYWDAVADLLTDWRFLEAKAEAQLE